MGEVGRVDCQGFLVRVFWWVELDFFSLDVYGFGVTLGSLYITAQGYIPAFLENLCDVLLWNLLAHGWSLVSV